MSEFSRVIVPPFEERTDLPAGEPAETRLEALGAKMAARNIRGYWEPRPEKIAMQPHHWSWSDVSECLSEAGELVSVGRGGMALRRNVSLANPSLKGRGSTSPTIAMGMQLVNPGEVALAHRHTASAIRFVIDGSGGATTSNGEQMLMERGDLLIQPNWTWHDHANSTDLPVVWLDVLDVGLVNLVDANFHEDFADDAQTLTKPPGYGKDRYGAVRSADREPAELEPPYRYEWSDTWRALEAAVGRDTSPYDGTLLEYTNPVTGGHTFRTMDCHIQLLGPGQETKAHRHTGHALYHVFEGRGATLLKDGDPLEWNSRDCFVLPSWRWHAHRNLSNTENAILFSVTDRPLLESMRLYREEGD